MAEGADQVHAANTDLLILFSGLNYELTLSDVVKGNTSFNLGT